MVLGKLDQTKFPFFREQSSAAESDIFNNNCYNNLTLEVTGASAVSLKVQACVNVEDSKKQPIPDAELVWSDLAIINGGDFSVSSAISANGIYFIGISGTTKIRLVLESVSGAATVVGVLEA